MLEIELPEREGSERALWVFDEEGQPLRTLASPIGDSVSIDLLRPPASRPLPSLEESHPKLMALAEELTEAGEGSWETAIGLLIELPGLAAQLGEPEIPTLERVIAWGPSAAEPRLAHAENPVRIRVPLQAFDPPPEKLLPTLYRAIACPFTPNPPPRYRSGDDATRQPSLPRLETWRSRRVARGRDPRLHCPHVSEDWDFGFLRFFLSSPLGDRPHYARYTARFLGPLAPRGAFRLVARRGRDARSVSELRQLGFAKTTSMSASSLAFGDEWLVDRMLNGFHPVLFLRGGPIDGGDALVWESRWDDYAMAPLDHDARGWGLAPGEHAKTEYELPNVRVELERRGDALTLRRIELQFRRERRRRPVGPDERETELEAPKPYAPGEWGWDHAKLWLRCALALSGEIDVHLASAHLMTEQYLAALEVTFADERDHPVYRLLHPYLRESDQINAYGDSLVFGAHGALVNGSALAEEGVEERLKRSLAARDWKGFSPRAPVVATHRYARAARLFWDEIRALVTVKVGQLDEADWDKAIAFSRTLQSRSLPHRPLPKRDDDEWLDRAELSTRDVGAPSMSAIDPEHRVDDLIALATHAIFHAVFVHTWVNDRQFEDVGDPWYACFGLMTRREPPPTSDSAAWDAWRRRADPLVRDAAFQMVVSRILTHMSWGQLFARRSRGDEAVLPGFDVVEPDLDVHEELRERLKARSAELEAIAAADPFHGRLVRHRRDALRLENFRARVNT